METKDGFTLFFSERRNAWALRLNAGPFQSFMFCTDLVQLLKPYEFDFDLRVEGVR